MRLLIISVLTMLSLPYSVFSKASDGVDVYCDNRFNEYQHSISVKNLIGVGHHRTGYLQIQRRNENKELQLALAQQSEITVNNNDCSTWIGDKSTLNNKGLVARIHFGFDKYALTPMGNEALTRLAQKLHQQRSIITIDGHTDNIGTNSYNETLGMKRALSAFEALKNEGISESKVVLRSYGESEPIATNDTEQGRSRNRRAEVWTIESN